jgi:hypothetical protein
MFSRLEEYRDALGGAEVRLMTQQHWPFEVEGVPQRFPGRLEAKPPPTSAQIAWYPT